MAFTALHAQTVSIRPWLSESTTGWKGKANFGSASSWRCRVEMRQRRVMGGDGREQLSVGRVIIAGIYAFSVRDELTLPAGYNPQKPPIMAVEQNPDPFSFTANTVLYF